MSAALPPPALQELRDAYQRQKTALLAAMLDASGGAPRGVRPALARLARLTDDALRALWRALGLDARLALVAVGGYGRGELFPYSDVDVLLLLPDDDDAAAAAAPPAARQQALEAFVAHCWDMGLEIGSSVRSVRQCLHAAAEDITICTALSEARLVAGSRGLFAQFSRRFAAQLDPLDFLVAKQLELRQRHAKFEDTPYALEPNCKESPGGLRDLQVILWTARAAGLGQSWRELGRRGLATPREARQLARNQRLLSLIRARLHLLARRREDRLLFDLQTAVAESLGLHSSYTPEGRLTERAGERLMRKYYWCAKAVSQLNQILMQTIEERLRSARAPAPKARRIDGEFLDKGGLLEVADDGLYQRNPRAILRTFLVYQQELGINALSARTLRALYDARALMDGRFRADPANRATFVQILQQPSGIVHALRLMNQTSVLGRYLWAFRRIVGQMQHDLFHVYTVDQHILMVLRNVRRFFMPEHAHEYPFCSQLAAGWEPPWVLFLAALFHDIAKGRGGDHSELGARQARLFCRQHAIARPEAELIEFLVREHLTMSNVAQKQDLADPEVIARFAHRMGNERRLTALYLLTVADIRGTSPKVWNAWKGKLLDDLYRLTLHALGGHAPETGALVQERKRAALAELARDAGGQAAPPALWDTLDVGYFMRHDAEELAWHARQLAPLPRPAAAAPPRQEPAVVRARVSPVGEGLQVMVYCTDRADLFARICGYFDRAGFSILDARVHTARNGYALDTFQIATGLAAEHHREIANQVETGLPQALAASQPLPPPRQGRVSRRVRSFPVTPRVDLRPDDKGQRWLLGISASDRVGLLYGIARVLSRHHISVELAKISTLGERVEDTFLLQGEQLQDQKTQIAIERELLEGLELP